MQATRKHLLLPLDTRFTSLALRLPRCLVRLAQWGVMYRLRPVRCPTKWLGFSRTCGSTLGQLLPVRADTLVAATLSPVPR